MSDNSDKFMRGLVEREHMLRGGVVPETSRDELEREESRLGAGGGRLCQRGTSSFMSRTQRSAPRPARVQTQQLIASPG